LLPLPTAAAIIAPVPTALEAPPTKTQRP
jgi:hypothetical protein